MDDNIEQLVADIKARRKRQQTHDHDKADVSEQEPPKKNRKYLPKPPPPKLHKTVMQQVVDNHGAEENDEGEEFQPAPWEDEGEAEPQEAQQDWVEYPETPTQDPEQEADPNDPSQQNWEEQPGETQENPYDQDHDPNLTVQEQENQQDWEGYENPPEEEWDPEWENVQAQEAQEWEPDDQNWMEPEASNVPESPMPAPKIVPIKGMKPENRPKFLPLNRGAFGMGTMAIGHPTPLTHAPPATRPRAPGFVHPIDDPRLAAFFAAHKQQSSAWQPPEPPIPYNMQNRATTMIMIPAQSKAGPKKRMGHLPLARRSKWQLPRRDPGYEPSEEEGAPELLHEDSHRTRRCNRAVMMGMTARRRHIRAQLPNGRQVTAQFWEHSV